MVSRECFISFSFSCYPDHSVRCHFLLADPTITTFPSDLNVVSRKSITLACRGSGKPDPVIVWSHNSQQINPSSSDKYSQSTGGNLTVDVTSIADEGTYQCTVSNKHSSVSTSARVTVQGDDKATIYTIIMIILLQTLHSFHKIPSIKMERRLHLVISLAM